MDKMFVILVVFPLTAKEQKVYAIFNASVWIMKCLMLQQKCSLSDVTAKGFVFECLVLHNNNHFYEGWHSMYYSCEA